MGLFGGNKTETQNPTLKTYTYESDKRKYPMSKDAQQLISIIRPSLRQLSVAMTRNDEQKLLSANLILMEQNEIIIKYLDDICKKIDKMSSEE